MRVVSVLFSLLACAACSSVDKKFEYTAQSPGGFVIYDTIFNVDFAIRKVDLESGRPIGNVISLPASHRVNATRIEANGYSRAYRNLEPGAYALLEGWTGMFDEITGPNHGCGDQEARVFRIESGKIGVLPRSFYRITDTRQNDRTGVGEEGSSLATVQEIFRAYPNITAPVELLPVVAIIKFGPQTSNGFWTTRCGSGLTFEITKRF